MFSSQMSFNLAAGEVLEGVYVAPQNKEESRKNVEEVLQFISSRHIRMPHISARGKTAENSAQESKDFEHFQHKTHYRTCLHIWH